MELFIFVNFDFQVCDFYDYTYTKQLMCTSYYRLILNGQLQSYISADTFGIVTLCVYKGWFLLIDSMDVLLNRCGTFYQVKRLIERITLYTFSFYFIRSAILYNNTRTICRYVLNLPKYFEGFCFKIVIPELFFVTKYYFQ